MKRIRIIVCMNLCALLIQTSCSSKKEEKAEEIQYEVTNPIRMDTTFSKDYVSQIQSVRNIEIRGLEKGYLQQIYVDEGQSVKSGQLLFKIMPKFFEAEYLKTQAQVKAEEIELQNTKALADKNIVSKNELALAQAKVDQAKAEMSLAKLHVTATEIRAPFDGTVDRIPLKLGSLVDEGQLLTSLSDNSQVYAYFNVSESEYLDYQTNIQNRSNTNVSLLLANNQPLKYKGKVETIESEFNNETGSIAFRARFPNPDKLLKNGETGRVQMLVPLKNALIIPQKATYEIQDKTYVFVIDKSGVVKSRNITISNELPDLYVVSSGLSESDTILIDGIQKVKDDDKIKFEFKTPKEVLAHLQIHAQ
ncbi:efflux RND transporter periplasmic adaptor subunit [Sphingobacterium sp. SRCM116780]|uniref:efflux RND transporter periplasmic adaptor subunit n=1 Tax=Sphingobacterium sp. SRCM116780 TaxID=2907623 RepID=UPI001F32C728|nr:efflux RND transporter periplasmic adaptor subunit [Sphingobacterium sp. SRCM116780]UIR55619.1 efflux RND transporter periplasmic adaptor subunit [Sphingobacterium sp. SRCM116780]